MVSGYLTKGTFRRKCEFLEYYLALLGNVFYIYSKGRCILEINKEVLKGHIDTLILSLLLRKDMYGFEIAKIVREKSGEQFELKEGTLYLSLKRLEKNACVVSYLSEEVGQGGRKKYYKLTALGRQVYENKCVEWSFVKNIMDCFIGGEFNETN